MLSHEYRCIFIHIPKVAGQSIEHLFLGLHGLTWETRAPLLLRANNDPRLGPPRLAHLKASEYVSCGHITQETFNSYFKFSFVRNPWSRLVSVYKYLGFYEVMPFKQFLTEDFDKKTQWESHLFVEPQYEYLFDDSGHQLVDFIGRFESLQADFEVVCNKIGIPSTRLPHVNESAVNRSIYLKFKQLVKRFSPPYKTYDMHNHYAEYYDNESKQLVADYYARDIEVFHYEFGE